MRPYETVSPYFGCLVGRTAFRIANGRFNLDGTDYQLTQNDGAHHLHGGHKGLNKVLWRAEPDERNSETSLRLIYDSPDGEEGYPGNLEVVVTYRLSDDNALQITYDAQSDRSTPISLTNHSYFNLAGHASGDILGHELLINADHYNLNRNDLTPLPQLEPVNNTGMDFTRPVTIGSRIAGCPGGYDHNYALNNPGRRPALAADRNGSPGGRSSAGTPDLGAIS